MKGGWAVYFRHIKGLHGKSPIEDAAGLLEGLIDELHGDNYRGRGTATTPDGFKFRFVL